METDEWWNASVDRPVPGDEIGPNGNNLGAGGGRNLHLRTSSNIRVSGASSGGLPQLSGTIEPDKCFGWNGTQLVPARGAESANE